MSDTNTINIYMNAEDNVEVKDAAQIIKLKGPKGDKGDTGERGHEGPKGDMGAVGPQGPKGDPFTYADFTPEQLEALKGPKGDKGEDGRDGTSATADNAHQLLLQGNVWCESASVNDVLTALIGNMGKPFPRTVIKALTFTQPTKGQTELSLKGEDHYRVCLASGSDEPVEIINGTATITIPAFGKDDIVVNYFNMLGVKVSSITITGIKDLQFTLSPHSFFQVNPEQTTVLYDQALKYADLKGNETVIDAYCGTGTISLFLAHKAKHVIGIEIVEPAIINARENARHNGYDNTEFIVADAAVEMPKLYKAGVRPDVIVFDPIRAGCKEEVLTSAAGMEPKRIVYVSCNPATMARDIEILTHYGYELKEVQPVDMFPMTAHVEAVALLTRNEVTQ